MSKHALEHTLITKHPDKFSKEFVEWFTDNGHVWDAFVAEAQKVRALGFTHYSARTIVHVLRHHSVITEVSGAGWKVNNNHSPYLARLFDLRFPSLAGMWEYRTTTKPKAVAA